MRRRTFGLPLLLGSLAVWRGGLRAQPQDAMARVGVLRPSAPPLSPSDPQLAFLPRALAERGYVEGRNLQLEYRWAGGDMARLPDLARELLRSRVDLIVAFSAPAVRAVQQAAPAMPVVMLGNFDPVALGLVASLARPGGSITGVLIAPDGTLAGKRLELLKAAVPQARRVAYLTPPADASTRLQLHEASQAAATLGIELSAVEVADGDYARAFEAMAARRPQALLVAAHTFFVRDREAIIALALRHRWPTMFEWPEQAEAGGLLAYGASLADLYQRVAEYVDRILDGAKPGDLPVLRPERYELVVNLATAKAIGVTLPQSLLLRADRVIR